MIRNDYMIVPQVLTIIFISLVLVQKTIVHFLGHALKDREVVVKMKENKNQSRFHQMFYTKINQN